jgi:hypothetical protein
MHCLIRKQKTKSHKKSVHTFRFSSRAVVLKHLAVDHNVSISREDMAENLLGDELEVEITEA